MEGSSRAPFVVLLVEPENPKNIGFVARAMSNFGVNELRIVTSQPIDIAAARVTACWATEVLENIRSYASLAEAIGDLDGAVGFSAVAGKRRVRSITLDEFTETGRIGLRMGLVFGPESSGLHEEHMQLCRNLVRIPTNSANASINLSHAVAVALYALRHVKIAANGDEQFPSVERFTRFEQMAAELGRLSGFLGPTAPPYMGALVAGMFRRIAPNDRELRILEGYFGRLREAISNKKPN